MPYRDLREFLAALEKHQELRTIQGADWNLEIGTITELNYERQGPALLFDSIEGYPKGFRVLANAMDNLPRSLLALDLPSDLDMNGALDAYTKKIASYTPVPPFTWKRARSLKTFSREMKLTCGSFPPLCGMRTTADDTSVLVASSLCEIPKAERSTSDAIEWWFRTKPRQGSISHLPRQGRLFAKGIGRRVKAVPLQSHWARSR